MSVRIIPVGRLSKKPLFAEFPVIPLYGGVIYKGESLCKSGWFSI